MSDVTSTVIKCQYMNANLGGVAWVQSFNPSIFKLDQISSAIFLTGFLSLKLVDRIYI